MGIFVDNNTGLVCLLRKVSVLKNTQSNMHSWNAVRFQVNFSWKTHDVYMYVRKCPYVHSLSLQRPSCTALSHVCFSRKCLHPVLSFQKMPSCHLLFCFFCFFVLCWEVEYWILGGLYIPTFFPRKCSRYCDRVMASKNYTCHQGTVMFRKLLWRALT